MNRMPNPLTERLRIRHPLIQAPMAGGPSTPALVAAVANAGGLGSLAGAYLHPAAIREAIAQVRALTDQPFAVNLFVPTAVRDEPEQVEWARELLAPHRARLGLPADEGAPLPSLPRFDEQLEVLVEEGVEVFSFAFGVPSGEQLTELQDAGIVTIGTATHLLEALVLEECGVDFIVAQGAEAGAHRGGFVGDPERVQVGTMALVPLLASHLRTPVIAAGGIMDGRGIAAALALGAAGAQLGTAFLACPESGAHPLWKQALLDATEVGTELTRVLTGRSARALRNPLLAALGPDAADLPGFPALHLLTQPLRHAAAAQGCNDYMALWAGQGAPLCETRPAAELVEDWMAQVAEILGG